jgi:hypothetical protein
MFDCIACARAGHDRCCGLLHAASGEILEALRIPGTAIAVASRRYFRDLLGYRNPVHGLSATWRLSRHYPFNLDGAVNQLPREASNSPLGERASARVITISLDYSW